MKHSVFFNFLSLNTSSLINKILTFILFIFLVQIISTKDYGIYNIIWAHIGLLGPFVDFGTTNYGLLHSPKEDKKRFIDLLSFRFFLSIAIVLITILLAFIFQYSYEVIIYVILCSMVIIANMWSGSYLIVTSLKNKSYLTSIVSVIFTIITVVSYIFVLQREKNLISIFVLTAFYYGLYALVNWYLVRKEIGGFNLQINIEPWKEIIKKSYIFVLISFFAGLYFKIDVLLLKVLQSESEVGIYSAGYKFFEALIFIASSYSFTSVPILVRLFEKDKNMFTTRIYRDIFLLGSVGILGVVGVYIFAPLFLPFILKGHFTQSIYVLRIVILALPFIFCSTVLLNALYIAGKTFWVVYLFIFLSIFNVGANFILVPRFSYIGSAWITLGAEILNTVILYILFLQVMKNKT